MTNYDFACCNLTATTFKNDRKKFKELSYGDKVYCVCIWRANNMSPTDTLYQYTFKNAMMERDYTVNPKLRKAIFYLTDQQPYIGFKADMHKSGTIVANHKNRGDVYIRVYATSKEEAIERAEKLYGKPIRHTLTFQIVY